MRQVGRRSVIPAVAVIGAFAAYVLAAPANKDLAAGLSLVKKGKYTEARPLIEKACQADSRNALAKLTLATLEDSAAAAESLYIQVAADSTAADSLRATAETRLRELYFVKQEYRLSAAAYGHARRFKKSPETALAWARSQLMSGAADSAEVAADSLTSSKTPAIARQASWISGECRLSAKEYARAYSSFGKAIDRCDTCAWYLPALMGRYRCAVALDSGGAATRLRAEIEKNYPQALEDRLITDSVAAKGVFIEEDAASAPAPRKDTTIASPGKTDTAKTVSADSSTPPSFSAAVLPAGPPESYTIQVGSFGTRSNARALAAKLKPDFPEVVVVEAVIKDISYYRVRIGAFRSLKEARAFADERFKGRSIRFQLVKL
jgi:cell division septation protein DedD